MEIFLISFFSGAIIYITVRSIIKVLNIALSRKEITRRKHRLWMSTSILIGFFVATTLPFAYHSIFGRLF